MFGTTTATTATPTTPFTYTMLLMAALSIITIGADRKAIWVQSFGFRIDGHAS